MNRNSTVSSDPYRELFERSADPILIIEGAAFVDCNDAAVKMLRYDSKADVLRLHPSEISPPRQPDGCDSFEKATEFLDIAFTKGSHRFEWVHKRADGELFPVEVLLTVVMEEGRRVLHVVWRDIAERKLLEDSLRHAQKMDAVGKLAGGVAHDFNNLLVAILGHADLLEEKGGHDCEALDHIRQIRGAAERSAALVRQLLAFGRKQQLLPEVLDLSTLVKDLRPLLERLAGADLPLTMEAAGEPLQVEADRGQIEQVLMNLTSNARDATPERGELRIRTQRDDVTEETGLGKGGLEPGAYAVVSVADSGTGMEPDVAAQACDPFFTTKGQGGTGLGLATAYGIAQQSGGTLLIDSALGAGTTVSVYLPITGKPLADRKTDVRPLSVRGGSERVLVVEDEAVARRLILSALEAKGYDVHVARDGVEGQEMYERSSGEFDLIVSDVILPNATGPEMVSALEAQGYHPRVLFLSGYTNDALTRRHRLREGVDLLPKPFSAQELAGRVRGALDGSPEA